MVQAEFLHFATFAIYSWEQRQKEELWGRGAIIAEEEGSRNLKFPKRLLWVLSLKIISFLKYKHLNYFYYSGSI